MKTKLLVSNNMIVVSIKTKIDPETFNEIPEHLKEVWNDDKCVFRLNMGCDVELKPYAVTLGGKATFFAFEIKDLLESKTKLDLLIVEIIPYLNKIEENILNYEKRMTEEVKQLNIIDFTEDEEDKDNE